ncbi:VOC family protein [Membranihabitans marinus]|uniref:VOC family protein n=1 Tax=Membranihabitans marinus TaxID=1227546 RepID=UPI001F43A9BE|nr:VOC family protein [Membranihabitans marinus]
MGRIKVWFHHNALEALSFYGSFSPNSKITFESPVFVHCELKGRGIMGLNGGPALYQL